MGLICLHVSGMSYRQVKVFHSEPYSLVFTFRRQDTFGRWNSAERLAQDISKFVGECLSSS